MGMTLSPGSFIQFAAKAWPYHSDCVALGKVLHALNLGPAGKTMRLGYVPCAARRGHLNSPLSSHSDSTSAAMALGSTLSLSTQLVLLSAWQLSPLLPERVLVFPLEPDDLCFYNLQPD